MKALLSSLLCFVLLESQVFAIHGGPAADASATGVTGTYAGVLVPKNDSDSSGVNSLGLFTFGIATTGLGSGNAVIFSAGRVFTGTVTAFGDTENARIQGLIETTYTYTLHVPTTTTSGTTVTTTISDESVTASAKGTFDSYVEPTLDITSNTAFRITGTAKLSLDQGEVEDNGSPVISGTVKFVVDGVQQSTTATTSSTTSS